MLPFDRLLSDVVLFRAIVANLTST